MRPRTIAILSLRHTRPSAPRRLQVLDKRSDTFVLFYKPSTSFCEGNATVFGGFAAEMGPRVKAYAMHAGENKSPFVFSDEARLRLPAEYALMAWTDVCTDECLMTS